MTRGDGEYAVTSRVKMGRDSFIHDKKLDNRTGVWGGSSDGGRGGGLTT